MSSTLVTALGNVPGGPLDPGGTIAYTRRLYVGGRNDVRSVSNPILTDLAPRTGLALGTISGDVDAEDTPDVRASILVVRLGRCADESPCRTAAECGAGACVDPAPAPGFAPGGAVTHVRTEADGTFSGVVLPNGDYELVGSAPERDDVVVRPVEVLDADTAVAIPALSARGTLAFRVREKRRGKPAIPAKLVIQGLDGTPDPRFGRDVASTLGGVDVRPETFGGTQRGPTGDARGQGNVVYTTTGEGSIELRPGRYAVWASRGMEYGIGREDVTVTAGGTADVDFLLKRVIKSRDALGADFHVHSVRSFDASTPLEDRVASFAAEGVEVMVSTEHDKHVDYEPIIQSLGLAPHVLGVPGVEVTGSVPNPPVFPNSIGHLNAWPMTVEPDRRRDGSIDDEYVAPNWIYSRLADLGGDDVVIQYNHVRAGVAGLTNIGFFNSIGCGRCANAIDTTCAEDADCPAGADRECTCVGYQPDRPLDAPPNDLLLDDGIRGPGTTPNPDGRTNLDFHVMEIANGAREGDVEALVQVRRDWFSLLLQDVRRWATGVSDSHRATVEHAGWARTFVLGAGDDPRAISQPVFDAQVRAGAMVIAAGPYVEVSAKAGKARAGLGEELAAARGKVRLSIRVTAPAWIPVDEVRIVVSGEVAERFDATTRPRVKGMPKKVTSSGKTVRFRAKRTLRLERDAFVVVEAGIPLPGPGDPVPTSPEPMNAIVAGAVPFAITNPIFVDVGADGYEAPGLPAATAVSAGQMTGVGRAERA
ncbi:MAG TPA: CehA/McbA family metallohydrolase, partial [Actinomycetota bacterium]